MAKPDLGTKRTDPETGKKFYDLNRDPIISPYTGLSYPRSYFEASAEAKGEEEDTAEEELDTVLEKPEFSELDTNGDDDAGDDIPDLGDDEVDLSDDDNDTFLSTDDEEDDDDVSGLIGGGNPQSHDDH